MKNKETLKQIVINYIDNKIITFFKDMEESIIKAIVKRGNKTEEHITKEHKSTRKYISKFNKKLNPLSKDVKEILESQKRMETKIDYLYDQLNIKYEEDKRTNVEILKSLSSFPIYTTKDNTNTPF
jgi:predicted nuclease with TOPRIM domain